MKKYRYVYKGNIELGAMYPLLYKYYTLDEIESGKARIDSFEITECNQYDLISKDELALVDEDLGEVYENDILEQTWKTCKYNKKKDTGEAYWTDRIASEEFLVFWECGAWSCSAIRTDEDTYLNAAWEGEVSYLAAIVYEECTIKEIIGNKHERDLKGIICQ